MIRMSDRIYHLATCSTCKAILKELAPPKTVEYREIKLQPITPEELDHMKALAGSYEALFSRKAIAYRERNLKDVALTEADYRRLILEEYTFLKRPVVIAGDQIFIGSALHKTPDAKNALRREA